eukprot:TRINITY_DN50223_c0_g1_i1.p1 TRINITY_DN50223_c0_g1~~TRINITY_DN50223_c0_g1_i1.p1  ORF type:complete len:152 (-),score=5.16 TRINITY_DN50223_c0_g1_i1:11-466(-)
MSRKKQIPIQPFQCRWDEHRQNVGCNEEDCSCGWTHRCRPRYVFAQNVGNKTASTFKNIGVCDLDERIPMLLMMFIPALALLAMAVLRSLFSAWKRTEKVDRRRMDALCDSRGASSMRSPQAGPTVVQWPDTHRGWGASDGRNGSLHRNRG